MSVSSVSRLAIINGRVAFLAPEIGIVPLSLWPPLIRIRSMPPPRVRRFAADAEQLQVCGKWAAPSLAGPLILGNSGGIVSCGGVIPGLRGRASFGLGLAALEIFPQRSAQTPLAPRLFGGLGTIVHGARLRPSTPARKPFVRWCALAPLRPLWQGSRHSRPR